MLLCVLMDIFSKDVKTGLKVFIKHMPIDCNSFAAILPKQHEESHHLAPCIF